MRIPRRRRLEKKTDYKARFALLKSGKKRLVVRKTNKYIIVQIVETVEAQDKVVMGLTSKDLLENKWPKEQAGSLKSIQAGYLTGWILGKRAQEKGISSAIFDMGMNRNIHKSRLYGVLKGAIDSGLEIPHNPEALPSNEELQRNEKLKNMISKIIGDSGNYVTSSPKSSKGQFLKTGDTVNRIAHTGNSVKSAESSDEKSKPGKSNKKIAPKKEIKHG